MKFQDAAEELTDEMIRNFRTWRGKLSPEGSVAAGIEETDRVFAAQMASHFLELALRPSAVRKKEVVAELLHPSKYGKGTAAGISCEELAQIIADSGAMLRGHFELLSKRHSDFFFSFSRIGSQVQYRTRIAGEIANRLRSLELDTVAAPVTAGGLLLQEVARHLKKSFAYIDVGSDSRPTNIRRGYEICGRVGIINDAVTTGSGLLGMERIIKASGAELVAIGLVVSRGVDSEPVLNSFVKRKVAVEILASLNIASFEKSQCPKCADGQPVIRSVDINK